MAAIVKSGAQNLSRKSARVVALFAASAAVRLPRVRRMFRTLLLMCLLALAGTAGAALPAAWLQQLEQLAERAAQASLPPQGRVDIEIGAPDPRLRLADCRQVQPFLPTGTPLWGRSRLGLRCVEGPVKWSISLPLQVRVFAPAWVAAQPLPAGTQLQAEHLQRQAEVELSAETSPAFAQALPPLGRSLSRPLQAGEALRQAHLKPRQWFAAGEPVRLLLSGQGFAVRAEGQAMAVGLEGQLTRVRLQSGRILQAWPVAEQQAEVLL